jgi:hypothetical protein
MGHMFSGFRVVTQFASAIVPAIPPVLVVLAVRLLVPGGRSFPRAIAELALFSVVAVATTYRFERGLVKELVSYIRRRAGSPAPAAVNETS